MALFSEEEMMMIAVALDDENSEPPKKQRRVWVHEAWQKRKTEGEFFTLYKELVSDDQKFWEYFRMSENCFDSLVEKIGPYLQKQDTNFREAISPRERLAVCLRYLATGDAQKTISFSYRLGGSTVHQIIHETCRVIVDKLMPQVMPTPTKEMWQKFAADFYSKWDFPNCVAAMDGKHVTIKAPPNSGSKYYNYKKSFSIVLLALVDAHCNFIAVDVGSYGKDSDGGIFAKSNIGKRLEEGKFSVPEDAPLPGTSQPVPYVIVGDEAFPLKTYLMRPYPGQNLNDTKRVFNYRLSRARRVSENAFGMLAAWCRMYYRTIHANPENIDYLILASCVLHNYIRQFHGVTPTYNASSSKDQATPCLSNLPAQGGNASRNAFNAREAFKNYFNSDTGAVPWQ